MFRWPLLAGHDWDVGPQERPSYSLASILVDPPTHRPDTQPEDEPPDRSTNTSNPQPSGKASQTSRTKFRPTERSAPDEMKRRSLCNALRRGCHCIQRHVKRVRAGLNPNVAWSRTTHFCITRCECVLRGMAVAAGYHMPQPDPQTLSATPARASKHFDDALRSTASATIHCCPCCHKFGTSETCASRQHKNDYRQ